MATKAQFVTAYRAELVKRYEWAQDAAKLSKFMDSVEATLNGMGNTWNKDGEAVEAAWRSIGFKGKPTYKALRELD